MKRALAVLLLTGLAACSTYSGNVPRNTSIIPAGGLHIFPNYVVTYTSLVQVGVLAGVIYMVTDPTSPAWTITETRLPDNRVFFDLRKQYFSIGGDGEVRQVLGRRAQALAQEKGFTGYRIDRYEESIESRLLMPRRLAYAEVTLMDIPPAN